MATDTQAPAPITSFDGDQPFRLAGTELVPENIVADAIRPLFAGDCIDIGCGIGRNTRLMPEGSVALDFVSTNLREIPAGYRTVRADVNRSLPFADASFDVAFCGHVMEHAYAPFLLMREIHRILRPGGIAIMGVPNPSCGWMDYYGLSEESDWSEHLYGWDWKQLRRFVTNAGFRVEATYANYPNILKPLRRWLRSSRLLLRFGADVWCVGRKSDEPVRLAPAWRLRLYRLLKGLGFKQSGA